MAGTLPPILVELKANAREFMSAMGEARHEVAKVGTESSAHMAKFAAVGRAALFGIASAAVVVGGASLELADRFEKANARLEGAIANAHASFDELKPAIDATNDHLAHFGFTSDDVESSLASLVNATKNPTKSLNEMGLAADIAKGRNISLEAATQLLVKVQTGHVALLGRLGIATKDASGHTISQTEAVARLSQMYGGDAARSAETFAGKTAALKAQVENLGTQVGLALIPVLEALVGATTNVIGWFEKHRTEAMVLAGVVGGTLTVAIGAYLVGALTKASQALTLTGRAAQLFGVQAAEGEAAASLPLLPWIALVAAVGVAAFELYRHWSTVWGGIKAVADDVWGFLKKYGVWIIAAFLGPIALAALALYKNWHTVWDGIQSAVTSVWSVIGPVLDDIKHAISDITGGIGKVAGIASHLPGAGIVGSVLSHIPGFATGTSYAPGGLARVGELGPELIDLPRGSRVYPHGTGPGGGGTVVNVRIDTAYGDTEAFARSIRDALLRIQRRGGSLGFI